jgi:hypothetical protein
MVVGEGDDRVLSVQMIKLRRQFEDLLSESGLLRERSDTGLTSSERMARHGEIRQLKEAKRNHTKEVGGSSHVSLFLP